MISPCSAAKPFLIAIAPDNWAIINDAVMGGISRSSINIRENAPENIMVFSGNLSLENNGGFASARANLTTPLPAATHVVIQVMGDGKQYQLRLRTHNQWDAIAYAYSFETKLGQWQQLRVSASQFSAVYRGKTVTAPKLNLSDVKQLGFLIADKQSGPFCLYFKAMTVE
ncbi:CIA30 family protein [Shewanella youngdeokensis]|uniref:CIA30 family protein n=1 Tax=Shewanella youngdeokensis TaxID=2999068 RepID=A0ABZ0K183_9GAMM|nr:CIA30 family protein [Shewanella sp. DAU334]